MLLIYINSATENGGTIDLDFNIDFSINFNNYKDMKFKLITHDVVFDTVDITYVYVSIVNNSIKLSTDNTIPFSGGVVNYLKDKFGEDMFECDFDNNTNCDIYIKPLKEELAATMRKTVDSTIVEFGFVSVFYDVVDEKEEED